MDADPRGYYAALNLTPEATQEDIRRAFRALIRRRHPDVEGRSPDRNRMNPDGPAGERLIPVRYHRAPGPVFRAGPVRWAREPQECRPSPGQEQRTRRTAMSAWRRYDSHLMPVFHERFVERWGMGTAPFLDPEAHEAPLPRAQWINIETGAALAVVPVWTADDTQHRSFGVFYLPPAGDIWVLRPGYTEYLEPAPDEAEHLLSLRNDAFRKAVAHAKEFLYGPEGSLY